MEERKIVKIWDNGAIRELSEIEIAEYEQKDDTGTPYKETISYGEAVNLKIRERYTESQEFAILRQKDEKPEEYAQYYAYCEECKKSVKKHIEQSTEEEYTAIIESQEENTENDNNSRNDS